MKVKMFTAFSGYDSQMMAALRLAKDFPWLEFDLVGWAEFDPLSKQPVENQPAVVAHNAIFPQWADRNRGDISKIDWDSVPDFDVFTYSSPCQDFSIAGLQRGGEEGSGTRSSLLWECERAIATKKPKYLLFENVKALVSKRNKATFDAWCDRLAGYGYRNYWKVLNAKNYGVPQNRERVFMVSILGEGKPYVFPEGFPLNVRLKDVLESEVDEKYYLKDSGIKWRLKCNEKNAARGNGFEFKPTDGGGVASTVTASAGSREYDNYIKVLGDVEGGFESSSRVYDTGGIAPTIKTMSGGGLEPKILTPKRTDFGKQVRKAYENGEEYHRRGEMTQLEPREDGLSNTLTTVQKDNLLMEGGATSSRVQQMEEAGKIPDSVCFIDAYNGAAHEDVACTIRALDRGIHFVQVEENKKNSLVYEENGKVYIRQATKEGRIEIPDGGVFDASYPKSTLRRSRVQGGGNIVPTVTMGSPHYRLEGYRIRKLTERECFRLMGVDDKYVDAIKAAKISKTQQYKMAGNSIVVDVLYYIFRELFKDFEEEYGEPFEFEVTTKGWLLGAVCGFLLRKKVK